MKLPFFPDYSEPVDRFYAGAFVSSTFTSYILSLGVIIV